MASIAYINDDVSLKAKIDILLQNSLQMEGILVVIVLLTRIQSDDCWNDIAMRQEVLDGLAQLAESKHDVLVRLACQSISRFRTSTHLGSILMQRLSQRHDDDEPLSSTDVDLLNALGHEIDVLHCQHQQMNHTASEMMNVIWNRFNQFKFNQRITKTKEVVDHDWQLMIQTLEALLQSDDDDDDNNNVEDLFEKGVIDIWLRHGAWFCSEQQYSIPWYLPLLSMGSSTKHTTNRTEWHYIIFHCTQQMTAKTIDMTKKTITEPLWNLILAHIGSSDNSISSSVHDDMNNIRVMAWNTAAHLIETFGWDWMMLKSHQHALGSAKHMCTLVRLASGEWRIQLGQACLEDSKTRSHKESPLLAPCGRSIIAAFYALITMEEEEESSSSSSPSSPSSPLIVSMSSDALLHLRHSFHDAYHSTVSYLSMVQQGTKTTSRLLGCFLQEFSVWDDLPEGITIHDVLQATQVALTTQVPELLPCLVTIMESAIDVDGGVLLESGLLSETLVDYLALFWSIDNDNYGNDKDNDNKTQSWACQVIDLWYSLTRPSPSVALPLAKQLLHWIDCNSISCSSSSQGVLSEVVGSYVVLMGEQRPSERASRIIERALEVCYTIREECVTILP